MIACDVRGGCPFCGEPFPIYYSGHNGIRERDIDCSVCTYIWHERIVDDGTTITPGDVRTKEAFEAYQKGLRKQKLHEARRLIAFGRDA